MKIPLLMIHFFVISSISAMYIDKEITKFKEDLNNRKFKSFEGTYEGKSYCIVKIRNEEQNSVSINGDVNTGFSEEYKAISRNDAAKIWLALKTAYKAQTTQS